MSTHLTFCRICEASCGLEVEVQDDRVTRIRPDKDHPVTKGYACVKGIRFDQVQHAPDRVLQPLKRTGDELVPTNWESAIEEIGDRLRAIIDAHGPQSVGFYIGNPCGFSTTIPIFLNGLITAVRTKKVFSVGSLDCANKFRVSHEMYGSPFMLTFPDIENTKFLMMIGANPAVSHTSVVQMPHPISARLFDLNRRAALRPAVHARLGLNHERLLGLFTLLGCGMTPRRLAKRYPHGRLLKPNRPGWLLKRGLLTPDGKVELAPIDFLDGANAELESGYQRELRSKTALKLIGKREKRGHNSWMHNIPALGGKAQETNRLYMHPDDASEAGLRDGDLAEVGSKHGTVHAPVQISDDLMRYVVALPHGWGHRDSGLEYASTHRPGVNVNALAGDGVRNTEGLSGMAQLTAFPVRVKRADGPEPSEEQ